MTVNKGTVCYCFISTHYTDLIMSAMASQFTSLTIVYSTVYSSANLRKHPSFASLAFVRGIHRGPVNFPHKWPVTRKMFPFYDVIMNPLLVLMYQSISYYVPNLFHRISNHSCILHPLSALYCAGNHYCSWTTKAHSLVVFNKYHGCWWSGGFKH